MTTAGEGTLTIGELARRTGLSARALRHYDSLGLFTPAWTDPVDGYRFYDEAQVTTARLIARLRAVDAPLALVRAVLAGAPEPDVRRLLAEHRAALQARDDQIRLYLHALNRLLDDERGLTMALNDAATPAPSDERSLAAALFNEVWTLLAQENRTPTDDDRMVHMAHASRFHWGNVGTDQHRAIGEWQVARVYATLGRAEPALHHARRCVELAAGGGMDDWVAASAQEALARALAVAGDREAARDARDVGLGLARDITDPEDREIVMADLDTVPVG